MTAASSKADSPATEIARRIRTSNLLGTWDANLDNGISKAEFEHGLAKAGVTTKAIMFAKYDVNNDQKLGLAEWDTFKKDAAYHGWSIID